MLINIYIKEMSKYIYKLLIYKTMSSEDYYVINRSGESVQLDFNKILSRLTKLKKINPELHINVGLIAQNTIKLMANDITTIELDNISANFCASMITTHPDYGTLAARIEIDNLHRETLDDYYQTVLNINNYVIDGVVNTILDNKLINFVKKYNSDITKILRLIFKKDWQTISKLKIEISLEKPNNFDRDFFCILCSTLVSLDKLINIQKKEYFSKIIFFLFLY